MAHAEGQGSATGALFMTGFGALWAMAATSVATSTTQIIAAVTGIAAVTIALLIPSLALLRTSQQMPDNYPDDLPDAGHTRSRFNLVFLIQGAAIGLTIFIANLAGRPEFITPVIAIIVGVHFLPLAGLFRVPLYYLTGALLILIPLVVMIAIPSSTNIDATRAWLALPAAGSALVLWLTALGVLRTGRAAVSRSQIEEPAS